MPTPAHQQPIEPAHLRVRGVQRQAQARKHLPDVCGPRAGSVVCEPRVRPDGVPPVIPEGAWFAENAVAGEDGRCERQGVCDLFLLNILLPNLLLLLGILESAQQPHSPPLRIQLQRADIPHDGVDHGVPRRTRERLAGFVERAEIVAGGEMDDVVGAREVGAGEAWEVGAWEVWEGWAREVGAREVCARCAVRRYAVRRYARELLGPVVHRAFPGPVVLRKPRSPLLKKPPQLLLPYLLPLEVLQVVYAVLVPRDDGGYLWGDAFPYCVMRIGY
ncbi:hypothetical protein PLICRDRAFT_46668, partial [Plicaturopsis crispa FD-325 SS-3]